MKSITINKTINFENGSIAIKYQGICQNEDVNIDKVNQLLDNFIKTHNHKNMVENVAIVRTILKDYEEQLLAIYYENENGSECVKYDNHNLFFYQYDITKSRSEESQISIEYNPGNYLDFSFEDFENNIIDYPNSKKTITQFTDILNKIYQLKHIKAIELDRNSKQIIEIYKLFYDENPDFSKKNINIKVQTMLSILIEFGISLEGDYGFQLLGKDKMPISLELQQQVNKLFPLGEVTFIDDPIPLSKESKRTIKIVGECIREAIGDGFNKDKQLITISKIIHAGRYNLPSNSNIKKLSEFANRTPNEVKSSIRLVKRIEKKINQENTSKI